MCGIAGIVYNDRDHPTAVAESVVRRMCTALKHRGPDDEGLFVGRGVGLGMRRLSIIDLDGGRQPIFNEDRSKTIVFNGEIYNYRDLRAGLLRRGHTFGSAGDTETILHLYEERGSDCPTGLRGMFAFAIWDASAETLLLARDRFGIKPLYVLTAPWGIAFASELKAHHAAELTTRALDWEALDAFFQVGYIPAPASPFTDIRKLEPGHTLEWRRTGGMAGTTVSRRYWDFPLHERAAPADAEARVREWLDQSVAAHLVSDVPVAAFLSGGLDSSGVVASMAAAAASPPHAFTARYTGSGADAADETDLAQALAARHHAELTVIDIQPDVQRIFEPIVHALDEPHADDSAIPSWLLSQAVGSRYKVALTGTGGDELFAGYRRHIGLLATEHYARLPKPFRRVVGAASRWIPEPRDGGLGVDRLKRFLHTGNGSVPDRFLGMMSRLSTAERLSLYTPDVRSHISGTAASARFRDVFGSQGKVSGLAAGLYLDYSTFLPDDILALSDRLSMAHSLEIRVPFVDHELVENVFPLPQRTKIGPLWEKKRLLRRALTPRLPKQHLSAPKRGFVGPTAAWLRTELRPVLIDELSADRQRRLGLFDPAAVQRVLQEHLTGRQNQERILWALLCFSTWHRLYLE
ncbi:MAG TPA: asparagine synthase (glutamine-hydrolyzing) [Gemmatimonadales bacterium]|nr:asparagine synthase (glutamine-hydrolyzing) [Gemmatimonadales bacterium]